VIDSLLGNGKQKVNPKATFFNVDMNNPKVFGVFETEKPDILYYLAGPINIRREITDPLFDTGLEVVRGFKRILDYARSVKIQKVIFASSGGAIYSGAEVLPTTEDYRAHPVSLYGLANLLLEKVLDEYYRANALRFITLRFSNVYGPRQWKNGVIPSFVEQILRDEPPLIHGDGSQTRDFVYIDDVVKALLIAAETEKTGIFNIGSGHETSLNTLVHEIAGMLHKKIMPQYCSGETEKTKRSVLDCTKAQEELKWEPKVSLGEGLKKTIDCIPTGHLPQGDGDTGREFGSPNVNLTKNR